MLVPGRRSPDAVEIGEEELVIRGVDATKILALFDASTVFSAVFPGAMPDGSDLVVAEACIVETPELNRVHGADLVVYSFTVTILNR